MAKNVLTKKQNRTGYAFLSLWLVGFIVFTLYPLFYSLFLSFNDVKLTVRGWETTWVGWTNYTETLLTNTTFVPALIEFIIMEIVYVPIIIIISFILASLLNRDMKLRGLFRTIYFLPVIVLSGPVMYQLIDSDSTKIGEVSENFIYRAIESVSVGFASVIELMFDNLSLILWFTGIPIILFINGLRKINGALYEAAEIDGATQWQILWKIKIPLIKPIAMVVGFFSIVQLGLYEINPTFELMKEALANTSGGMGIAATFAWLYSLVIVILVVTLFLLLKDKKDVKVESISDYQANMEKQRLRYQRMDKFRNAVSIEGIVERFSKKRGDKDEE